MLGKWIKGLSVGARLRIAFYAISGFSFVAALVAFASYNAIEKAQKRIVEQAVPSMIVAQQLVEHTFALTTSTSALAAVTSYADLNYRTGSIEAELTQLPVFTRRLREGAASVDIVDSLDELVGRLSSSRVAQEKQVLSRIEEQQRFHGRVDQAARAAQAILDLVSPVASEVSQDYIEDSRRVRRTLNNRGEVTGDSLAMLDRVTGDDLERVEQLIEMRFRAEALLSKIEQTRLERDASGLDSLKAGLDVDLRAFARLTSDLRDDGLRTQTLGYLDVLSPAVMGEESVFRLGAEVLDLNSRIERMHGDIVQTSEEINQRAASLLEEAERAISDQSMLAADSIASSRILLIFIVLVALAASSLIIVFIVGRQIGDRLQALTKSTLALAGGNHEVSIDVQGRDEFGALANAVRVFKNNSLLLREQERQLRRQTEALKKSEERFALAAEGSSVGIWDWIDIQKDEVYWSPTIYRLLGYKDGELEPSFERLKTLVHPDDKGAVLEKLRAHYEQREPYEIEYRLRHSSGEYRWFHATGIAALSETGEPVRMVGSIADITERKLTEMRLGLQSEELKRSNTELEQFAYVASHDLRAPLRGIDNLASWIESDLAEAMNDESRENMMLLRGRISRLETLLDDLLAFSRVGRSDEKIELVDVKSAVAEEFDLVLQGKDFTLVLEGDFPDFETAKTPLCQVLRNLMSNAIKHHDHDRGRITVSVSEREDRYLFSVKDDGPGIDPEFHERIFGVFQTLRGRDQVEGSGMGLAIVQKQLLVAGSSVEILSNPEQERGARFIFDWPKVWHSHPREDLEKAIGMI